MKSALLVINTMTYFRGLGEIGKMMKKKSEITPIFYFTQAYPKYEDDVAICEHEGLEYICDFKRSHTESGSTVELKPNSMLKKTALFLYGLFFIGLIYEIATYIKEFTKIRKILKEVKPSILILGGANVGYSADIFIKAGHRYRIPSVILPSWMAGPLEAAEAVCNNPLNNGGKFMNRIVGYFGPKWTYIHREKKLIRWPAFKIVAMKLFRLVPPLPWVLNSSYADKIAVESNVMKRYMSKEGVNPDQIEVTGSIANDILADNIADFENRKKTLYQKLKLTSDKPILLSALPPNMLYGHSRPECIFHTYHELVEFWMKSLGQVKNYHVVISLHPSVRYEDMVYIEKWGVKIAQDKITDLIPFCDIFVTGFSATMHWAIGCGKPIINYDVHKLRYDDYEGVKGVLYTEDEHEFLALLKKITEDKNFYLEIVARQKPFVPEWGILDGECADRLLKCFNDLIQKYT